MKDETPIELKQLDYVLKNSFDERDYEKVMEAFFSKETVLPKNDGHYLKMILNKLKSDGYMDYMVGNGEEQSFAIHNEAGKWIAIRTNFNGRLFLLSNGYTGEYERRIADEKAKSAANERAERYAKRLNLWTKCLFFGTIALVIVEILINRRELLPIFECY